MKEFLLKKIESSYQKKWFIVIDNTLRSLFPFITIISIIQILDNSFFSEFGFLKIIFYPEKWFPFYQEVGRFIILFSNFRAGLLGWLAAYFAATYTLRYFKLRDQLVGISSVLFYQIFYAQVFFSSGVNTATFSDFSFLGSANLLVGILIGFFVGHLGYISYYKFPLAKFAKKNENKVFIRQCQILITVISLSIFLNGLTLMMMKFGVYNFIYNNWTQLLSTFPDFILTLFVTISHSFFALIGFSFPFFQQSLDDITSVENLNAALSTNSLYNLPHTWTITTLYKSYGTVGGVGNLLAIIFVVLIFVKHQKMRQVGALGLFPALLGNGISSMMGFPVIFNLIYAIPFMITPLLNVLIASIFIFFKLVPITAYPVPFEAPGLLYGFLATGGSYRVLLLGLGLFVLDVIFYYPFVRWHEYLLTRFKNRREVLHD